MTLSQIKRRTEMLKRLGLLPGQNSVTAQPTPGRGRLAVGSRTMACRHLGQPTGQLVSCQSCGGRVQLKVLACARYGECTIGKPAPGVAGCCRTCPDYDPPAHDPVPQELPTVPHKLILPPPPPPGPVRWTYGVTTVPARRDSHLPLTLRSLVAAGFPEPRLFVDGTDDPYSWTREFGLSVTGRNPPVGPYGSWVLAAAELYLRDPHATYYALFQDDVAAVRNLRQYLEGCTYPTKGYWNLFTFWKSVGHTQGKLPGWYAGPQKGMGALGLVFSREALLLLLSSPVLGERRTDPTRGWRSTDGGVVTAMNRHGWMEYVHSPSLLQHTGDRSTFDKRKQATGVGTDWPEYRWGNKGLAPAFPGEAFDATAWLAPLVSTGTPQSVV